jgi:hypothetical protein
MRKKDLLVPYGMKLLSEGYTLAEVQEKIAKLKKHTIQTIKTITKMESTAYGRRR